MTGSSPTNNENPPQSPFCLSLTGKRLQRGRLLLPFIKGGAAVQSLITHVSEALGLWRRTAGRNLRKLFSEQLPFVRHSCGSRNPDTKFVDARFREHDKAEIGSSFLPLHSSSDRHTKANA